MSKKEITPEETQAKAAFEKIFMEELKFHVTDKVPAKAMPVTEFVWDEKENVVYPKVGFARLRSIATKMVKPDEILGAPIAVNFINEQMKKAHENHKGIQMTVDGKEIDIRPVYGLTAQVLGVIAKGAELGYRVYLTVKGTLIILWNGIKMAWDASKAILTVPKNHFSDEQMAKLKELNVVVITY